jgi:penicillin amidase
VNLFRSLFGLFLGRRLPRTSGTIVVPGLRNELVIRRDQWGVPHVEARDELDAYFGAGFCHGQDRAFQMETLLRVGRGTLAEVIGPEALPVDRLSRRIGFHHSAKEQWPVVEPDVRAMLEAYAAGVNSGRSRGLPRRAHEFFLLGFEPTPWTPLDSLGVMKIISLSLSSNWDAELARLKVLLADGPEALAALDPVYPEWLPVISPPGKEAGPSADRLAEDLSAFAALAAVGGGGSNNWTIAGSRTATGRPILANDPHLDATLPAHWYLAHLRCPQWEVAGMSFPGGPNFPCGHNAVAAWGVTAGMVDDTDLFREKIGPDGVSVREGDRWVPCKVREEVIQVKGTAPVTERVLVTRHGPIVSPALKDPPDGEALSLRAIWLDPRPIRGLLCLHKVRSFDEARAELAKWPATSQNVVYADTSGTIGWQLMGTAPRRRKGNGTFPQAGWDPEAGWEPDPVPAAEMPHLANPDAGFIATANNQSLPDGEGPFLTADYIDGYRVANIGRNLASRRDWDVSSTQKLQIDQRSLPWEEVRDELLAVPAAGADARQALDLLRSWDGILSADSAAAAVFELFLAEMVRRVARAKAPGSWAAAVGRGDSPLMGYNFFAFRRTGHLVRVLRAKPAGWFARPWPDEVADALGAVVRWLKENRGPDTGNWGWGHVRTLTLEHPFGQKKMFTKVFNLGPVPCGGDGDTINQASARPLEPLTRPDSIASMRAVMDVGGWENCRYSLPAGQSGNPLSPHYADLLPLWHRGEGVPIAWSPEAVEKATRETLRLVPGT